MVQNIIVTGASSGIGRAIAQYLIRHPSKPNLVVTARREQPLKDLESQAADRVNYAIGDMADGEDQKRVASDAVHSFQDGRVDALVLNHATLGKCERIAQMDVKEWQKVFAVNLDSYIVMIQEALPLLRKSKGRIILVSSGAATHAYSSWGAYGASKAALNHLAMTLQAEEPDVTTVSIRPGVVDTEMQGDIRDKFISNMDEKDQDRFLGLKKEAKLLKPEQPGHTIANLAMSAEASLSGQFLSWDDKSLATYQG